MTATQKGTPACPDEDLIETNLVYELFLYQVEVQQRKSKTFQFSPLQHPQRRRSIERFQKTRKPATTLLDKLRSENKDGKQNGGFFYRPITLCGFNLTQGSMLREIYRKHKQLIKDLNLGTDNTELTRIKKECWLKHINEASKQQKADNLDAALKNLELALDEMPHTYDQKEKELKIKFTKQKQRELYVAKAMQFASGNQLVGMSKYLEKANSIKPAGHPDHLEMSEEFKALVRQITGKQNDLATMLPYFRLALTFAGSNYEMHSQLFKLSLALLDQFSGSKKSLSFLQMSQHLELYHLTRQSLDVLNRTSSSFGLPSDASNDKMRFEASEEIIKKEINAHLFKIVKDNSKEFQDTVAVLKSDLRAASGDYYYKTLLEKLELMLTIREENLYQGHLFPMLLELCEIANDAISLLNDSYHDETKKEVKLLIGRVKAQQDIIKENYAIYKLVRSEVINTKENLKDDYVGKISFRVTELLNLKTQDLAKPEFKKFQILTSNRLLNKFKRWFGNMMIELFATASEYYRRLHDIEDNKDAVNSFIATIQTTMTKIYNHSAVKNISAIDMSLPSRAKTALGIKTSSADSEYCEPHFRKKAEADLQYLKELIKKGATKKAEQLFKLFHSSKVSDTRYYLEQFTRLARADATEFEKFKNNILNPRPTSRPSTPLLHL